VTGRLPNRRIASHFLACLDRLGKNSAKKGGMETVDRAGRYVLNERERCGNGEMLGGVGVEPTGVSPADFKSAPRSPQGRQRPQPTLESAAPRTGNAPDKTHSSTSSAKFRPKPLPRPGRPGKEATDGAPEGHIS